MRKWFIRHEREAAYGSLAVWISCVVILLVHFFFFETHKIETTIDGFSWERQIEIEDFQPRGQGDWEWDVPGDAYDQNSYRKVHHYDSVYTGESCTGTGNERRCTAQYASVAVYRTWIDYRVDRWQTFYWLTATEESHTAFWPDYSTLDLKDVPVIGNLRLGEGRQEKYTVLFKNGRHATTGFARWESLHVETKVFLNLNRQDDIRSVDWPRE